MSEEFELETYLSISQTKYEIYLFNTKNLSCLYQKEFKIKNNEDLNFSFLSQFLENNIFKIEKLVGNFINRIFLILDSNQINNISICIKKKNYKEKIDYKILENILVDAKEIFNENYQNTKIMHIIIERFLANGNYYSSFKNNIEAEDFCIEVKFKSLSDKFYSNIDKVLKKYHIEIIQCIDKEYVIDFFKNDSLDFLEKVFKIKNGINQNEVKLVPKNPIKYGFFEKFFQLFS